MTSCKLLALLIDYDELHNRLTAMFVSLTCPKAVLAPVGHLVYAVSALLLDFVVVVLVLVVSQY